MAIPVNTKPLPPVPSAMALDYKGDMISQPWQQWFVNLRDKVNVINGIVASISGAGTPSASFDLLSPLTTAGDLLTYASGHNVRLPIGTPGQALIVLPGGTSVGWGTAGTASPLTTKGDLYGFSTVNARIPVGTDGYVLTADSTTALGISWKPGGGASSYDATVMADSPVGYWKLNEVSGTSAADSSGNGYNGTYSGGFTLGQTIANVSGGVFLNGTSGIITLPAGTNMNVGTTWTAEGWTVLSSTTGPAAVLVEKYTGGTNPVSVALGIAIDNTSGTYYAGGFYTGSAWVSAVGGQVVATGVVCYWAITYDNSNLRLYINGVLQAVTATSGHLSSNDGWFIGVNNTGTAGFLKGCVGNVALYNTTLSAARIRAHYLAGR